MTSKVKAALEFYSDQGSRGFKKIGTFNGGEIYGDTLLIDNGEKAKEALTELQPIPGLREAVEKYALGKDIPCSDNFEILHIRKELFFRLHEAADKYLSITEGE